MTTPTEQSLEQAREYRWTWFPPCAVQTEGHLCNKDEPCQDCHEAEVAFAALLDTVRLEQHEATLADVDLMMSNPDRDVKRWREAVHDWCRTRAAAPLPTEARVHRDDYQCCDCDTIWFNDPDEGDR